MSPTKAGVGQQVPLDGTGSNAPGGLPLAFTWSFEALPAGSKAAIQSADAPRALFVPDALGSYDVVLTVQGRRSDGSLTLPSAPAQTTVNVVCGLGVPQAKLQATPGAPGVGEPVVLSAAITDPDNGPPCNAGLSFQVHWSIAALPPGSHATISRPNTLSPQLVPDMQGVYMVALDIQASNGQVGHAQLSISAGSCGTNAPLVSAVQAQPPSPFVGQPTHLSAQVSDADTAAPCNLGRSLSYEWRIASAPAGSQATLSLPTGEATDLTPDVAGMYSVALTVVDELGRKGTGSTQIEASMCGGAIPTVAAIQLSPIQPNVGQPAGLTASVVDANAAAPCNLSPTLGYDWKLLAQPAGSLAQLVGATGETPWLTPDVPGNYEVGLQVIDGTGRVSPLSTRLFTAGSCGSASPVASASARHSSIATGQSAELLGAATDADSAPGCGISRTLTFAWKLVQQPTGSHSGLNDPATENPTFVADIPGSYTAELVVTDELGRASAPVDVQVTASGCGAGRPSIQIRQSPSVALLGQPVALAATVTDPNSLPPCGLAEPIQYAWAFSALPLGSVATIRGEGTAQASFVPDVPGTYGVSLTATDGSGQATLQTISVVLASCGSALPTAVSTASTNAPDVGETVALSTAVADANVSCGAVSPGFSYAWSFTSLPSGSRAVIASAAAAAPSFTPDVPGAYLLAVVVTDGLGRQSPVATVSVAASTCGTNPPVLGSPQVSPSAPGLGLPVQLSAALSDSDNQSPCNLGKTFRYQWALVGLPIGSLATLNAPESLAPSLVPDVPGSYIAELTVVDSAGLLSQPLEVSFTASSCGAGAPTATLTASTGAPDIGQPVQLSATISDPNVTCGAVAAAYRYAWTLTALPAGSHASLNDTAATDPSIVPDVPGTYGAELIVTDPLGRTSAPAPVTFTASACGSAPPVAEVEVVNASGQLLAGPGASVVYNVPACQNLNGLSALASSDADALCGLPENPWQLGYRWNELALPAGSKTRLEDSSSATPWVSLDTTGNYVFQLWASDGNSMSATPATATLVYGGNGQNQTSIIDAAGGGPASLAEVLDIPRISYQETTSAGSTLRYAECTGSCFTGAPSWGTVSLSAVNGSGAHNSIQPLGNSTNGLALASTTAAASGILFQECADSSAQKCLSSSNWTSPIAISTGSDVPTFVGLSIRSNVEALTYYDSTSRKLGYTECASNCTSASSWSAVITVDSGGASTDDVGQYTSITLDNNSPPHRGIGYYDATAKQLKYAQCVPSLFGTCTACGASASCWTTAALTTGTDDRGQYASIATGPVGATSDTGMRISFYDATAQDLWLGVCTGSGGNCSNAAAWALGVIDPGPQVGRFTTNITDSNCNSHIAYLDEGGTIPRFRIATVPSCNNGLVATQQAIVRSCTDKNQTGYWNAIGLATDPSGTLVNQLATTSPALSPEFFYTDP
ncbi:MAG: hypothetical protein ACYCWW_09645 [Deltaproteobacteria bacterium]